MIHGLPQNADEVTDECVGKTVITDMKTEITVDVDRSHHLGRPRKKQR